MDEKKLDQAAMKRLAGALAFVCGAEHPTTIAVKTAAESGAEKDIKKAYALFVKLKSGERRAALTMMED